MIEHLGNATYCVYTNNKKFRLCIEDIRHSFHLYLELPCYDEYFTITDREADEDSHVWLNIGELTQAGCGIDDLKKEIISILEIGPIALDYPSIIYDSFYGGVGEVMNEFKKEIPMLLFELNEIKTTL